MPDEDIYGPLSTEEGGEKIYEDLCSFKPPTSRASTVSLCHHSYAVVCVRVLVQLLCVYWC